MFTTELQYVVVRYMLNDLADEAANIGLVAVTPDPPRVLVRFLEDPTVKSRGDARVKRDVIERFIAYATARIRSLESTSVVPSSLPGALFPELMDLGGNMVRVNQPRSVLTNDVEQEFDTLYDQWVSPLSSSQAVRSHGPRDPLRALRREAARALIRAFREGYGRSLSRKAFARPYEVRGATHKNTFDLALLSGSKKRPREHIFQHVLQLPDAEESFTQAAALCWRWSDIRAANHANRSLTAVLYERPDHPARGLSDTTKLFKAEQIEVARLDALPGLVKRLEAQGSLF